MSPRLPVHPRVPALRRSALRCTLSGIRAASPSASRLETPAVTRHREAEDKIDRGNEDVDLDRKLLPGRIDDRGLGRRQQVEDADDQDEAGVLEEGDEGVDQRR